MIAKSWFDRCWQWQIGGCVAIFGTLLVGGGDRANAQIVPDNTLGAESSVVTPKVNIRGIQGDRIDGGAIRGANLFHSFEQLSVLEGRGAYFTNPAGILNILSRVTGANRSDILGRLGVTGNANLFLINPKGIVFGPSASLDLQGSFLATTADAIQFPNGEVFSASMPSAPSSLLTVNPSAFLFNQVPAGALANYSRTPVGATPLGEQFGLRVPDGRSLLLLGGDIAMDGGGAIARGGRIDVGSIAGGSAKVGLNVDGNDLSLSFPDGADRADISLSNGALVSVNGEGGGDIQVQGRRITLSGGSQMTTNTLGTEKGGTLAVTAAESVELIGTSADGQRGSGLFAQSEGSGNAGDLTINTRRLLVRDGAQVSASTRGSGNGGSLQITNAESVELIGTSADGQRGSGLFARSERSGDAGDLTINTRRLLVRDGAQVSASTRGSGNGGSLQITNAESVELIGTSADGQRGSGLFARSEGSGNAGDLTINTRRLLVRDGAQVSTDPEGSGKGGSLQITATNSVEVIGRSADGQRGSRLSAQSEGSGNAGDLTINTGRLLVRDGAQVSAATTGSGNGGNLQITAADSVEVIGRSADGSLPSGLFTTSAGSGNAGDLTINTWRLLVSDGALVSGDTRGAGKGGSLQITASDSVEVIGSSANGRFPSGLSTESQGSGDAGNLRIDTRHLLVRDGAHVSTDPEGSGKGGSLQITATNSVEVIDRSADGQRGSRLSAQSEGSGNAGDLTINTGRLLVRDGAQVSAATTGSGNGGNLQITAADSVEVIGSSANGRFPSGLFTASAGSGNAGDLTINTWRLLVSDGALVSGDTRGAGKGGSLQITATNSVEVIGTSANGQSPSGLLASSSGSGNAGNLRIDTGRLLVRDGAQVSSSSTREGTAGNINITARDTLQANNGTISTTSARSSGGSIDITASNIRLSANSDITSRVNSGAGGGGNIDIKADSILAFDDSDILAFAREGRGGNITLDTPVFFGESYRPAPRDIDPGTLSRNNRVDINATGNLASGNIALPDTTSIQNSLTELPENRIDTDSLLASSCIVRRDRSTTGSFTVTGTGGLPQRPGDVQMSEFPTVDVETLPSDATSSNTNPNRSWQKGDPIVEPQGVYRLPNGKLVMSRECL